MTGEPSLLEAFRGCGPLLGVPEADGARDAAAARLLRELRALAPAIRGFTPAILEDATQVVLLRLFKAGPRGVRHGDPESDAAVRAYLLTALRNVARDLLPRPAVGELSADIERRVASPVPAPDAELEDAMDEADARQLLASAETRLGEVVTAAAKTLASPAQERFLATVGDLADIAAGRRAFDRLVEDEAAASGAAPGTARNRLYKRYSRVLGRLVDAIVRLGDDGELSPSETRALLGALDRLRLRERRR